VTEVMMEKERSEATPAVPDEFDAVDEQLVEQLTDRARSQGLELTGEGGLLAWLTKRVVDSALGGELDDHLGYAKHVAAGRDGGNPRNGTRAKTVLTEAGPVSLDVPRDRAGSFSPQLVKKRQRRLSGLDELVISRWCCRGRHSHTGVSPHWEPSARAGHLRSTRQRAVFGGSGRLPRAGVGVASGVGIASGTVAIITAPSPPRPGSAPQGRIAAPHGVLGARVFTVGGEHCG